MAKSPLTIFVTGGAGYIGSHTALEFINAGHEVICVDNLYNSHRNAGERLPESLKRVEELTKRTVTFYEIDICDKTALLDVFNRHKIDCVVHFAALKAVGESCRRPLEYYHNNVTGMCVLLEVMRSSGVFRMVYSSSATVYGEPETLPMKETNPTGNCTNPYGKTKYFTEEILKDLCAADKRFNVIALRYFNPIGAHQSGHIGEDPNGEPNNLLPYISQVAIGKREFLKVFGSGYDTHDGTGVRDYTHVIDLAAGHVCAVDALILGKVNGFAAYNLGTGNGYSVLEIVNAFKKASGREVPYKLVERRSGDIATSCADPSLAAKDLGWRATKGLQEMCADTWNWQQKNPNGYKLE